MKRVQRKRTKGYKLPENCIYVGRPTKWGNPYPKGSDLEQYRLWLWQHEFADPLFTDELEGKDLACWCPLTEKCHADIILEFLNAQKP